MGARRIQDDIHERGALAVDDVGTGTGGDLKIGGGAAADVRRAGAAQHHDETSRAALEAQWSGDACTEFHGVAAPADVAGKDVGDAAEDFTIAKRGHGDGFAAGHAVSRERREIVEVLDDVGFVRHAEGDGAVAGVGAHVQAQFTAGEQAADGRGRRRRLQRAEGEGVRGADYPDAAFDVEFHLVVVYVEVSIDADDGNAYQIGAAIEMAGEAGVVNAEGVVIREHPHAQRAMDAGDVAIAERDAKTRAQIKVAVRIDESAGLESDDAKEIERERIGGRHLDPEITSLKGDVEAAGEMEAEDVQVHVRHRDLGEVGGNVLGGGGGECRRRKVHWHVSGVQTEPERAAEAEDIGLQRRADGQIQRQHQSGIGAAIERAVTAHAQFHPEDDDAPADGDRDVGAADRDLEAAIHRHHVVNVQVPTDEQAEGLRRDGNHLLAGHLAAAADGEARHHLGRGAGVNFDLKFATEGKLARLRVECDNQRANQPGRIYGD